MSKLGHGLTVRAVVDCESDRTFRAGGPVTTGHAIRKDDGNMTTTDSLRLCAGNSISNRSLELDFGTPLILPVLIAELALADADEDESSSAFNHRMSFRDDLISAFEEAVEKLKRAPRT